MAENTAAGGVAVLGMHRSGTSAVAGFLAKAGFWAGGEDALLPAAEDNPKGFFERADVNELNDQLLADLGGAWDKPPRREVVAEEAPRWKPRVERLLARLDEEARGRPLVLKDPRISLVLPAWLDALERRFAIVLIDRSPLDIAHSVRRRDGRPLPVALALWQLYTTALLDGWAGRRVLVVHYETFARAPEQQGRVLMERVGEVLPAAQMDMAEPGRAEGFVSPDMRHHCTGLDDPASLDALTGSQLGLGKWLAERPADWAVLDPPAALRAEPEGALVTASEYYDAVADRYGMETAYDEERHKALHFEQATELKDKHIENLEAALAGLRRQEEERAARAGALDAEVDRLRAENDALSQELRRLQEDGRAAAGNLLAVAKRSLSGKAGPAA